MIKLQVPGIIRERLGESLLGQTHRTLADRNRGHFALTILPEPKRISAADGPGISTTEVRRAEFTAWRTGARDAMVTPADEGSAAVIAAYARELLEEEIAEMADWVSP